MEMGFELACLISGCEYRAGDHRCEPELMRARAVDVQRKTVMNKWRDFWRAMVTELFLFAYVIAWGGVLLVTHMLTK